MVNESSYIAINFINDKKLYSRKKGEFKKTFQTDPYHSGLIYQGGIFLGII